MKRRVILKKFSGMIMALALVCGFAFVSPAEAKKEFLTLATGSPGGVYYPLGGGMSVVIQKTIEGVRCAAESTGASVENTRLVSAGESDMGMVMGSTAYAGINGTKPFKKKHNIQTMFQMYPAPMHIVTTARTGIKTLADLKGKKVSIDRPGSGGAAMSRVILSEAGFDLEKDLELTGLSVSESIMAMKDGIIDAIFLNFAYPAAALLDLSSTREVVLIPLADGLIEQIITKHPYYVKIAIPANTYATVKQDTLCLGDSNLIVVNADMREDLVYKVVKSLFENVNDGKYALINIHPIAAQFTPQNAINSPVPLHPGAERYFREVGAYK